MRVHNDDKKWYPSVALRGLAILPGYVIHFDVSREKSVLAVEQAMKLDQKIFLTAQKNTDIDDPGVDDLYKMGVIAKIHQVIKVPDNRILRVLVEGESRAEWQEVDEDCEFLLMTAQERESINDITDENQKEAMMREITDLLARYLMYNRKLGKGLAKQAVQIQALEQMVDFISANIPMEFDKRQKILEAVNVSDRYQELYAILQNEAEIEAIRLDLQKKVKDKVEQNQKKYVLREQMQTIREELGEDSFDSEIEEYRQKTAKLKASKEVKEKINKEIDRLESVSGGSSESSVIRGYIEILLELPWNKASKDNPDIKKAKKILEKDHYGLKEVKTRILEFLAVRALNKKGEAPIICLVGPPGTGKTSIARSIASALDKKYVRICLGGVRDEAEIRGHRKTYVGAMPGRIINGLRQAGVNNPLMLLDEIDKVSSDYKGDTQSALLEVMDSEQNCNFRDHYVELSVDLSDVFFIATANSVETISRPLLDRMEIIEVSGYTADEKYHIGKEYLITKQMEKNGLKKNQFSMSDRALKKIIQSYTREAGVRNLERNIASVCRKAAWKILEEEKSSVKITEGNLKNYLGKEKYHEDMANEKAQVGIVRGLAWTSVGGVTLEIEVNIMPGKGEVSLTGKMGEVMQESAKTGISYIRSIADEYQLSDSFFKEHDIHVHIPEGAVPKDGPSAGITIATAILSAAAGREVRPDIAMTGEITLRGRVLPIGGLKEKLLAAKTAGMKIVLVPEKNRADADEIEDEIKRGMEIKFVSTMDEVIENAFV